MPATAVQVQCAVFSSILHEKLHHSDINSPKRSQRVHHHPLSHKRSLTHSLLIVSVPFQKVFNSSYCYIHDCTPMSRKSTVIKSPPYTLFLSIRLKQCKSLDCVCSPTKVQVVMCSDQLCLSNRVNIDLDCHAELPAFPWSWPTF